AATGGIGIFLPLPDLLKAAVTFKILKFDWLNIYQRTQDLAAKMVNTPGCARWFLHTGHSIDSEYPQAFATEIVNFLSADPDPSNPNGKGLSSRTVNVVPEEDCKARSAAPKYSPMPPDYQVIPHPDRVLANPSSAEYLLTQRLLAGGNFADGSSPGTYS